VNTWCAKGLLILALVFSMVTGPLGTPAAAETPPFPGSGSGTADDPYIITSYEGLDWMRNNLFGVYKLGNDITFEDNQIWQPIGADLSKNFRGVLDGDGHTIRNLKIEDNSNFYIGLFGVMQNGTVKNLKLENVNVSVTNPTTTTKRVGAVAGYAWGSSKIENVSVTGQVNGNNNTSAGMLVGDMSGTANVSNVYLNGTVKNSGEYTGGVTGKMSGQQISNTVVHATLDITSTAPVVYVGLVVGENTAAGKIINVSASGSYKGNTGSATNWAVGGMIGRVHTGLQLTDSYVSASGFPSHAGGICKQINGGSSFTVNNSFWDTGAFSGISTSCGGTGKSTTAMKQAATYSDWDPTVWKIVNGQYPRLILPPQIVIDASALSPDGSGTVSVNGYTFDVTPVTEYKWASGNVGIEAFRTGGGTTFTDEFDISEPGTYTVYALNENGGDSVKSFTVKSAALNSLSAKDVGSTPEKNLSLDYDDTNFSYSGVVSGNVTSVRFYPVPADNAATVVMKDEEGNSLSGDASSGFDAELTGTGIQRFTITVTNGGLSQEYKVELRTAAPLDVTLTPSTTGATKRVTVNIEASGEDNSAEAIRWAKGIHTIEDFSDESFGHHLSVTVEEDVSKAQFDVEENGDYTVYVLDAFSIASVSTIRVENIVKDAPSISFGAPNPNVPTAGDVSVTVTVSVYGFDHGNQLKAARWKAGQLTADSFAGGAGTDLLSELTVTGDVYQGQLKVSESGWYTVYVMDLLGNESVNSVQVTNIFEASSDLSGLALSHGELTPAFNSGVVSYTAEVENSVSSVSVTPTPAESHSTITVNGTPVLAGGSVDIELDVGKNTITIVVTALDGETKTYTVEVTRAEPDDSSDPDPNNPADPGPNDPTDPDPNNPADPEPNDPADPEPNDPADPEPNDPADPEPNNPADPEPNNPADPEPNTPTDPASDQPEDIRVIVDGKPQEQIASGKSSKDKEGRSVFTVTVDASRLSSQLEQEGDRPNVMIPVELETDKVSAVLTGDAVKAMENKQAVLEIRTPNGNYKLPAVEMVIDQVSSRLGNPEDLSMIEVHVEIARSGEDQAALLEAASENGGFAIAAPPVEFTITASYNGQTVTIDKFSSYVQREIPLPDGADPGKITTGVVVEPDGTVRHVPTRVILIDGKYYAVINSLTNSTYSVVWNPVEFDDAASHWAKDTVNNMGSRMIIEGTGGGQFSPARDITRAEFAAIIVRALGLGLEKGTSVFADVKESDWYNSAVRTAYAYGLLDGFADGTFRPDDKITREQAMVIISRAMAITGLKAKLPGHSADTILSAYADTTRASGWAIGSIADCVQAGIVSGRNGHTLAPQDFITRAEAAAMVERLLLKSDLI